jgi:hypothetical protein
MLVAALTPLLLPVAMVRAQSPVLVQQAVDSGPLLSRLDVTLPQLTQQGDLLVLCSDSTSSGNSAVSGGGVSNWILCETTLPTQDNSEIWAGFVDGGPSTAVRITLGGSPNDAAAVVTEWRGFVPPLAFTGTFVSGLGGTASSPANGGSVFAYADDLVVAMVGTHSTGQSIGPPTNGFVDLPRPAPQPSSVMAAACRIPQNAGTYGTSWTFPHASIWAGATVVFRASHLGSWGGSGDDTAAQVRIDPQHGTWVVAGATTSFGRASDILLARFDANGNQLSAAAWGGARDEVVRGMDLHTGTAPGIYLTGASNSFGSSASERDVVLVRYDLDGNLQWGARWFSSSGYDEHGEAVCVDPDGNAYVAGTINWGSRLEEALLLKFAPVANGSLPVAPTVVTWGSSSGNERLNAAVLDTAPVQPRLYVAGSTTSFGNGNRDVLVQCYSTALEVQWTRTWGGAGDEEAAAAAVDAQGNLYVAGSTQTGTDPTDALLLKWDAQGNLLWRVTFGGAAADSLRAVLVDCYGNVVVTGVTESAGAGQQDGLLAKFDADGNLLWAQTWGGAAADELGCTAIAACADLIVAGDSTGGPSLALWQSPTVQRSTSTAQVTSPSHSLGTGPGAQLTLPTLPAAANPGVAQGLDIMVQRYVGATTSIAPGCPAALTSTGGPMMSFDDAPVIGGAVRIRRTSLQGAPLTALLFGTQTAPLPLTVYGGTVAGGTLCINPATGPLFFLGTSPTVYTMPIQLLPILYNTPLDVQWIDVPELGNSAVGRLRTGW